VWENNNISIFLRSWGSAWNTTNTHLRTNQAQRITTRLVDHKVYMQQNIKPATCLCTAMMCFKCDNMKSRIGKMNSVYCALNYNAITNWWNQQMETQRNMKLAM